MTQKKKIAIWGIGEASRLFMELYEGDPPEIVIDNDAAKHSSTYIGRTVMHPSEIREWGEIFIIVATDYYPVIKEQLIAIGLTEDEDFIHYKDVLDASGYEYGNTILTEAIEELKEMGTKLQNRICIFSDFPAYDRGICKFVERWDKALGGGRLLLFSEATWIDEAHLKRRVRILCRNLPSILGKNRYPRNENNQDDKEVYKAYAAEREYLKWAADNLRLIHPDMQVDYEYAVCWFADRYIEILLDIFKPVRVVLWNEFQALHHIALTLCRRKGIPVSFMEFGNIPGTVMLEEDGQMGESYPAIRPGEFMSIPVKEDEVRQTRKIVEYLRQSRLNRRVQPGRFELDCVKEKLRTGQPVIFYAGQNDNESGLQPYTERTSQFHSPIFKTSYEAAEYLADLCRKNGWNFIYKPHPLMRLYKVEGALPKPAIVLENADIHEVIDCADITVTILSTVSYSALIRRKPVLMLGYTQLKDKGCTYQAFSLDEIEQKLYEALKQGFSKKQQNAFEIHLTQMLKYCCYDDGILRELNYGKKIEEWTG